MRIGLTNAALVLSLTLAGPGLAAHHKDKHSGNQNDKQGQTEPRGTNAGGFQPLFNGKNLDGWHNPYDWGRATVVDGEIRLTADKKFFLVTDETYGDFIFEAEIKMPDRQSNSGFMFRANEKPNKVSGYQAEVDPKERAWSGGLYDEARRGWLNPLKGQPEKQKAWKHGQWNHYRIKAVGDHIQIWVNGVKTTDYRDTLDMQGHLALQHHGEDGKVYRFRNIKVQRLGQHKWQPLFNGRNLDGWSPKGGGQWKVEDGTIVGLTDESQPQSVLLSNDQYDDFTARVEFRINKGNSGFYFRAERVDKEVIVNGFQAEIEAEFQTGGLYETGGRGWVEKPRAEMVKKHYTVGEWTTLTVSAHGKHVVTHVNGHKIVETNKPNRMKGYLGLQLHGKQQVRLEVRKVELLKPAESDS